jgi:ankyrin repeat protein
MSHRRRWELGSTVVLLLLLSLCAGYVYYRHQLSSELATVLTPPGTELTGTVILSWDIQRAMELVRRGASVMTRGHRGITVLSVAAGDREYSIVEELIRRGADVNTRDEGGMTPLYGAAFRNDDRMIRLLLAHGADPNNPNSASGWTPIFCMVIGRRRPPNSDSPATLRCVEALLNSGANVTVIDCYGDSVLDWAGRASETKMCRLLRQAGAKPGNGVARPGPFGAKK